MALVPSTSRGGGTVDPSTLAGYEFGYDQITAPVTVTATSLATPTTIIACAAHTFDGSPVVVQVYSPYVDNNPTAGGTTLSIALWEGATDIGILGQVYCLTSRTLIGTTFQYRFTPSAGSHTYTITAAKGFGGAGTCIIGAGASGVGTVVPAFARFTKA